MASEPGAQGVDADVAGVVDAAAVVDAGGAVAVADGVDVGDEDEVGVGGARAVVDVVQNCGVILAD